MSLILAGPTVPEPVALNYYDYANEQITIAGSVSPADAPIHYATDVQQVVLRASIMSSDNNGPFQVPVTLPGAVGLPLVRFANGAPTAEEIYLTTTIVNGEMNAAGTLPSGAWKLLPERVDRALSEINAPFRIALPLVTFIVSRGS